MSNYSRRDFLAHSAAAGMLALQADRLLAAGDAATARPADMAIARWKGPEPKDATDPQLAEIAGKLTHQAIDALGGMRRFVKRGDVVWVKPNIGWDRTPEQAGNTNPQVVAALVAMCLEAGAKTVKVGDNTVHAAVKTYESSGIAAAVKTPGGKMVFLDKQRYKEMAIHGERVKTLLLYPDIIECDLVINAAIVKHHVLSNATLCMKNYMGVMDNRAPFHQDFAACLADLTRFMKPRLSRARRRADLEGPRPDRRQHGRRGGQVDGGRGCRHRGHRCARPGVVGQGARLKPRRPRRLSSMHKRPDWARPITARWR